MDAPDESWFLLLAHIYIDAQRLSAADALLREAISVNLDSATAWHYLANVYLSLAREHEALAETVAFWLRLLAESR